MTGALAIIVQTVLELIPQIPNIESAVKDALTKGGYTNAQIDAIFADVKPLDQLGIDPNHPFADDPAPVPAPQTPPDLTPAPPPASQPAVLPPSQPPHTLAR